MWIGFETYITIHDNVSLNNIEEQIDNFSNPHRKGTIDENRIWKYNLQPLKDIHLKSDFRSSKTNSAAQTLFF